MADYHTKKAWFFYANWFEQFDDLSDEDTGKLVKAIGVFARTGKSPKLTGEISGMFKMIKSQIEADGKSWEKSCEKRSAAGKAGMQSRWNNNDNKNNKCYQNISSDNNDNKNNSKVRKSKEKRSNEKLTSLLPSSGNSAASDTGGEFLGVINIPEDPAYALLREED